MKASLKFRENQNPIIKAEIPFGFPFRSSIQTATSDPKDKDLCFSFRTIFQTGPVLKLFYRPNDSNRPFGFVVKTGVGSFGSPMEAPMSMSAEFHFLGNGNPSFFLQFKPKLGDFSIRSSVHSKKVENHDVQSNDRVAEDEKVTEKKIGKGTWTDFFAAEGLFGGEVHARTVFPIMDKVVVGKIGWSLKFPATDSGGFPTSELPYMVVNKLGIEHVWKDRNSRGIDGDVAEACLAMKKELGKLELEKECLWKEMEELQSEMSSAGKFVSVAAGGGKETRLRRMIERLKSRKAGKSAEYIYTILPNLE